jgi:hypothetical protein
MGITLTPKLQITKADGVENVDVVAHIDNAFDKIDTAMGVTLCTSSTRPATPFTGQQIYETDSKYGYIWSGSAWLLYARGFQLADVSTAETTTSGSYVDLATVGPTISNVPMIAGVTYKITVSMLLKTSNGDQLAGMGFAVSGADTVAAIDADATFGSSLNERNTSTKVCSYTPATTGNHTITAKYKSSGGATANFSNRRLIVE